MRVSKWGNSLAIRLPVAVVEALDLKEGDEIALSPSAKAGTLDVSRKPSRAELIKQLDEYRGLMPKDFKFDRDEANER